MQRGEKRSEEATEGSLDGMGNGSTFKTLARSTLSPVIYDQQKCILVTEAIKESPKRNSN